MGGVHHVRGGDRSSHALKKSSSPCAIRSRPSRLRSWAEGHSASRVSFRPRKRRPRGSRDASSMSGEARPIGKVASPTDSDAFPRGNVTLAVELDTLPKGNAAFLIEEDAVPKRKTHLQEETSPWLLNSTLFQKERRRFSLNQTRDEHGKSRFRSKRTPTNTKTSDFQLNMTRYQQERSRRQLNRTLLRYVAEKNARNSGGNGTGGERCRQKLTAAARTAAARTAAARIGSPRRPGANVFFAAVAHQAAGPARLTHFAIDNTLAPELVGGWRWRLRIAELVVRRTTTKAKHAGDAPDDATLRLTYRSEAIVLAGLRLDHGPLGRQSARTVGQALTIALRVHGGIWCLCSLAGLSGTTACTGEARRGSNESQLGSAHIRGVMQQLARRG